MARRRVLLPGGREGKREDEEKGERGGNEEEGGLEGRTTSDGPGQTCDLALAGDERNLETSAEVTCEYYIHAFSFPPPFPPSFLPLRTYHPSLFFPSFFPLLFLPLSLPPSLLRVLTPRSVGRW